MLFVMTLLFIACDDSSANSSADNDISSSSYEGESSSSLDSLEYVEPPKLSGREYNPDFNAIIEQLAPPLYNDGKWVMGRFEIERLGLNENGVPVYDRYYVFFVSKDDMASSARPASATTSAISTRGARSGGSGAGTAACIPISPKWRAAIRA